MIRDPSVAGMFYPRDKKQLIQLIENCFQDKQIGPGELPNKNVAIKRTGKIFGLILPHAGYVYSGPVAAHGFLEQYKDGKPEFFLIIGPNHTGIGPSISVYPNGKWRTPFGEAIIPSEIVEKIIKLPHFRADTSAHQREHSIEVQIPFLQYLYGEDVPIIPICLKDQSLEVCQRIGQALGKTLSNYDFCFIASTDLTHFESQASALSKDALIINCIKELNANQLLETVLTNYISMCGPGPVASALYISKQFAVQEAKILKYATSGDVTGDKSQVVAYLSALLLK